MGLCDPRVGGLVPIMNLRIHILEVLILLGGWMTSMGTTCLEVAEHHEFQTAGNSESSIWGPWAGLGIRLTMMDLTFIGVQALPQPLGV